MAEACCSCETVKEIINEIFDARFAELKEHLGKTKTKARKKREPSAYNKFIGGCVKEGGGDFKSCAIQWNACKKEGTNPCHWKKKVS